MNVPRTARKFLPLLSFRRVSKKADCNCGRLLSYSLRTRSRFFLFRRFVVINKMTNECGACTYVNYRMSMNVRHEAAILINKLLFFSRFALLSSGFRLRLESADSVLLVIIDKGTNRWEGKA
jgi:hypothetical protein